MKSENKKKSLKDIFKIAKNETKQSCGCSVIIEDVPKKKDNEKKKESSNSCGC